MLVEGKVSYKFFFVQDGAMTCTDCKYSGEVDFVDSAGIQFWKSEAFGIGGC